MSEQALVVGDSEASDLVHRPIQYQPAQHQEPSVYVAMLNMAIDKNLDMDKLERLMALQKDWEAMQAKKSFLASRSSFQSAVPVIYKQGHADFGEGKASYDYAKLEDIAEGIKAHLAPNGLSYSWDCSIENGIVKVTCTLSHIDGHSTSSTMISTPDTSGGKIGIHQIASARSYLKRYTLLDVAGVTVSGEDDDAQSAVGSAPGNQTTEAEGSRLNCTKELFDQYLPKWQEQILISNKDPQALIKWLETKNLFLNPEQQQILINTGK